MNGRYVVFNVSDDELRGRLIELKVEHDTNSGLLMIEYFRDLSQIIYAFNH